jgi:hypothetical protein
MAAAFRFPSYNYANFINDAVFANNPYARKYSLELKDYAVYALQQFPNKCPSRTATYGGPQSGYSALYDENDLLKYTSRFYANYYNFLENPVNNLGVDAGAIPSFKFWSDIPLIVLEDFELHGFSIARLDVTGSGTRVAVRTALGTPHGAYPGMQFTYTDTSWSGLNGDTWFVGKENAESLRLYKDAQLTQFVQASDIGGIADGLYAGTGTATVSSSSQYRYKLSSGGAKLVWRGALNNYGSVQPKEYIETTNGVQRLVSYGEWQRGWRVVRNLVASSNPTKWFRSGEFVGNITYNFEKQSQSQEQAMINTQLVSDGYTANSFNITTSNDVNPYYNEVLVVSGQGHIHTANISGYVVGNILTVTEFYQGGGNQGQGSAESGIGFSRITVGATVNGTGAPQGVQPNTIIEQNGATAPTTYTGGKTFNAGSFVVGQSYTINSVGNTNWTAIGAYSNTFGVTFVATGVGSGTGTAIQNTGTYKLSKNYDIASPSTPSWFTIRDSRYDLGYFPRIRTGTGSSDTSVAINTDNLTSTLDGVNSREFPGRFANTNPVVVFTESLPANTASNTRWKGKANDVQWEYAWETDTNNNDFGGRYDNTHNSNIKEWPRHIRPAGMTWTIDQPSRTVESQNLTRWTRDSGVVRWRFKLKYPPMTRAQLLPFLTAIHSAHGQARGFRWYMGEVAALTRMQNTEAIAAPVYTNAVFDNNIIYAGEPASAGATTFIVEGLRPGVNNAINAGDIVKIQHTTAGQTWWDMYMCINVSPTDELGRARVRISHPLKTAVSRGALCYLNPDHVFVSLNTDTHDFNIDTASMNGFEVEFVMIPQMNDTTAQDRGVSI